MFQHVEMLVMRVGMEIHHSMNYETKARSKDFLSFRGPRTFCVLSLLIPLLTDQEMHRYS
jgi:hypothetical protein